MLICIKINITFLNNQEHIFLRLVTMEKFTVEESLKFNYKATYKLRQIMFWKVFAPDKVGCTFIEIG